MFHGVVTRICRTQVLDEPAEAPPGAVTRVERDRAIVATGNGQLAILEIQTPGKRVMSMGEFLRGHAITAGDRFEDIL
jgi:methionyl-tRNA formyltransferase